MKIRAQIAMVLNLDKCIGCHTCSVTCKQVWTNRPGVEYAWFNNVESKPGIGYPKNWEDQEKWKGGWGLEHPKQGNRLQILSKIFANPNMPEIDDYYEPFGFDYTHLQKAGTQTSSPTARPYSLISKKPMEKIEWGPNWEDDLGGKHSDRAFDRNMQGLDSDHYASFENTFLMYLPRLCEHCLNPTCVASCPSGSIYKREEDGIVLVDQEKCRGWRMCVSGCPYKKIYFNWKTNKAEKCLLCYPRIESGQPTICSETCVGRMRYLGVILYDADKISAAASKESDVDLYQAQLSLLLDPNSPEVLAAAREQGIPESWLEAARKGPIYPLVVEWKLALPLHPEFRTLPMVWYIPPLSPILSDLPSPSSPSVIPDLDQLRIPLRYLANLFTAGDEAPVRRSLERLLALRTWMREISVGGKSLPEILEKVGLSEKEGQQIYQLLALARYEDRYVVPTSHQERVQDE
jgi:nitrate reductase beta subunit